MVWGFYKDSKIKSVLRTEMRDPVSNTTAIQPLSVMCTLISTLNYRTHFLTLDMPMITYKCIQPGVENYSQSTGK